jgi:hypothetical protein
LRRKLRRRSGPVHPYLLSTARRAE